VEILERSRSALVDETDPNNHMMQEPYRSLTSQVASILEQLGHTWADQTSWTSLLHKRTLRHGVEESIVALHHLYDWMTATTMAKDSSDHNKVIAVDVCGGKGKFSMLLSYMTSDFWQGTTSQRRNNNMMRLKRIILLEKTTSKDVDWHHIQETNSRISLETFLQIEIWPGTNLQEDETVLDKFQALCQTESNSNIQKLNMPLTLTGIHLCKNVKSIAGESFQWLGVHSSLPIYVYHRVVYPAR
jgi:hypothetical protein